MEISIENTIPMEPSIPENITEVIDYINEIDFIPNKENIEILKKIQEIILYYEDEYLSLDEVLSRVLKFYGKFVPYK